MFSLSGLRIGVVLSSPENMQYIRNYMPHYTVNCVALAFVDAIIENYDRVLDELLAKFKSGKEYLIKALDENSYSYLPTSGCFICIRPKNKTAEQITEELKTRNILIFCGKGGSAGFLRVTIWDKKYMVEFMEALLEIDR
jgi:histidinol-phosphate aminotransferase